jgi:hypothetical protein
MGLFYDQKFTGEDHLAAAIGEALQEQAPKDRSGVPAEAKKRAARVREDAKKDAPTLNTGRLAVAVIIAAALIIGAIALSFMVDSQAISEAGKVAQTPAYKPPELSELKAAAEWLRTLGAAWSAGLVAILLSEKSATTQ